MTLEMRLNEVSRESQTISAKIGEHARRRPEAPAVICDAVTLSYGTLWDKAQDGAAALWAAGCRPGSRIAILADNCADYVPAFLAILLARATVVTLPTMLDGGTLARMLEDSEAVALIVSRSCRERANEAMWQSRSGPAHAFTLDFEDESWPGLFDTNTAQQPVDMGTPDWDGEFNIVYSSGTTGTPKGIVHSHQTRTASASGMAGLGFDTGARTMISTPLYTNMSIPALLATLWGGGAAVIMPKFDPANFMALAEQGATHFFLVPVQVRRLFDLPDFERYDLGHSRLIYVAGSKLSADLKRRLLDDWPGDFVEVYGMSEGAPVTILSGQAGSDKLDSVGRPPFGVEICVIDDEGRPLPPGETGEIVGRSGAMMLGYNNRPDETEALIWQDERGRVFFRSGDIGYQDEDGFLYIVDRKKDVIISGGYNIYGADLEAVLMSHPVVSEAAVVGVPSERWEETPVGFVVLRPGEAASTDELLRFANERLGKFLRLSAVRLVDELPRNVLGKILKRELRERYGQDAGETGPGAS